ncbi:cation-translocating P-type ATPase [Mycoplasmoides genitalium]
MNSWTGLSEQAVIKSRQEHGANFLPEKKATPFWLLFLQQFKSLVVILLLLASLLSFVVAIVSGLRSNWNFNHDLIIEWVQPFIILLTVFANSLIGSIQEFKAQKSASALKSLTKSFTRVFRNGELISINVSEVVVGDIIFVDAGDIIPADGKLLQVNNLRCLESFLTGESTPVDKTIDSNEKATILEQTNLVFSGAQVVYGSGVFQVEAVGIKTQVGKIAKTVDDSVTKLSPLQQKLEKIGKWFSWFGLGLFAVVFLVQTALLGFDNFTNNWSIALIGAIALVVAIIPEGLVTFINVIFALSVQKLTKQKAIIKYLSVIETLGSVQIICTDKTGTLTQNQMKVVDHFCFNSTTQTDLARALCLCNNASISKDANKTGDPTEIALLEWKDRSQLDLKTYYRVYEKAFDSIRKLMTVVVQKDNRFIVIVKGAPDVLLPLCNNVQNEVKNMENLLDQSAGQGLRTLAVALKVLYKFDQNDQKQIDELENNLEFLGFVSLQDPPRKESKEAILACKKANITPIMITGDHLKTATVIAKELGILTLDNQAVLGSELDEKKILDYRVFARVTPQQKLAIVSAWKEAGFTVSVTGDGVNDAPALIKSDVGCCMGITGVDIAKDASDLIISDDNFATIVNGIEEGRKTFLTCKRVLLNLFLTSIAGTVVVLLGLFILGQVFKTNLLQQGHDFQVFSPTQLLIINLFVHGFPAVALAVQPVKEKLMVGSFSTKNLFYNRQGFDLIWQSLFLSFLTLLFYSLGIIYAINNRDLQTSGDLINRAGSTCGFFILGASAALNSLNLMVDKPLLMTNPWFFKLVWIGSLASILVFLLIIFINPLGLVFNVLQDLTNHPVLISYSFGGVILYMGMNEVVKLIRLGYGNI